MESHGVETAVVFPINEEGAYPQYTAQHEKIASIIRDAGPEKLVGFMRLRARAKTSARAELKRMDEFGFRGIKLHPLSDSFSPSQAYYIAEAAQAQGWPIVVHTSHNRRCTPPEWEPLACEFPALNLIFAHSGRSLIEKAIEVAHRCPNILFDTSINIFFNLKMAASQLPPERFLFASDTPYSHRALDIMKAKLIWQGEDLMKVMRTNALKILSGTYNE